MPTNVPAALAAAGLRVSTRADGDRAFTGVLRHGTSVVAECGHLHGNRDQSSRSGGTSAADCVRHLVKAALNPATADHEADLIARSWQNLGRGFAVPTSVIEQAKAEAPGLVAEYLARVAHVNALLAGAHVEGASRV